MKEVKETSFPKVHRDSPLNKRPSNPKPPVDPSTLNRFSKPPESVKSSPFSNLNFVEEIPAGTNPMSKARPVFAPPKPSKATATHDTTDVIQQVQTLKDIDGDQVRFKTTKAIGPEWQSILLPSKLAPYSFDEIRVRPLRVRDLGALWEAQSKKSLSLMVDALANTVDQDIRQLTVPDFHFLMFWQRLNSYPKSPMTIIWTSKYGNKNEIKVLTSSIEVEDLKISRDEINTYKEQGMVIPTVRDLEILNDTQLADKDKWFYEHAQYLIGDTPEQKLEFLDSSVGILEDIRDYSKKVQHGVVEKIKVKDSHFDAEKAVEFLTIEALDLKKAAVALVDLVPDVSAFLKKGLYFEELADKIKEDLAAGKKVEPDEEEVEISIDISNFFPEI